VTLLRQITSDSFGISRLSFHRRESDGRAK
jgi:hypothetical protein